MRHLLLLPVLLVLTSGCGGDDLLDPNADDALQEEASATEGRVRVDALTVQSCTVVAATGVSAIGYEPNSTNVPANVLDDNLGTRWSHEGSASWLQLDLGSLKAVGGMAVAWHRGNERSNTFALSASADGVAFTEVYAGKSSLSTAAQTYSFAGRNARYLRITVKGNTVNLWNSIAEARACAGTVIAPTPAPAPAPAPTTSGVVWRGDFETGTRLQWNDRFQAASEDRLQVVTSPVQQGRYALKVTVKLNDVHSSGNRAELVKSTYEPENSEYYYRFQVMFHPSYPIEDKWQLFAQWHHQGTSGSPPLEFVVRGSEIRLVTHSDPANGTQVQTVHWRTPLVRGVWHDFIIRVKWSPKSTVGFFELRHNGQVALPLKYFATQYQGQLNYLKAGLYRDPKIAADGILWHDGWVMGRTLADVLQ